MKKNFLLILIATMSMSVSDVIAESFSIKSPDGNLEAIVDDTNHLTFSIKADGNTVFDSFNIAMKTNKGTFGKDSKVKGSIKLSVDETIETVYGIRSKIRDNYNQLELDFDNFSLTVRAYDEAVAYRFSTHFDGDIIVYNETIDLPLTPEDDVLVHPAYAVQDSFEKFFERKTVSTLKDNHSYTMPFLANKNNYTVAVVESNLFDYPNLRFVGDNKNVQSWFAKSPKTLVQKGNYVRTVGETYDYIAKTRGYRTFPWRGFIVAREDIDLADNDTVYKLAEPSRIQDTSWIEGGTCVWEWWSAWRIEGVDFKTGVNEDSYRYYIDFAARNNIPFVVFDAGWLSGFDVHQMDDKIDQAMLSGKPFLNVPKLIKYAHKRGVKVILWCLAQTLDKYGEESFEILSSWNADGLKIDFADRDDQQITDFYERIGELSAKYKMLVDFHGCPKPAGIQRTYPNIMNFEALRGCEFNKFAKSTGVTPSHNIDIIFTRMLQGPMDYTPGGMSNSSKKDFTISNVKPNVMGTRSHMVAQFILYYAPLQMLCDTPPSYEKELDILNFISTVPTTWDDTKALNGKIGQYVTIARRKGDNWYVGSLSDWTQRSISIDLSKILSEDEEYKAEIIRDTHDSSENAKSYVREVRVVTSEDILNFDLKSGGGVAIKLVPVRIPVIDDIIDFFTGKMFE